MIERDIERPIFIPVVIDDVKNFKMFQMTRCTYFCVQCDTPSPNWYLGLRDIRIPFLMTGLSGILFRPGLEEELFDTSEKFETLFEAIEQNEALYVDTNDIWLPNWLFPSHECMRGHVYRIDATLFATALRFRNEDISEQLFLELCKELPDSIRYSPEETNSLRLWSEKEIDLTRQFYREHSDLRLQRHERGREG